jgi:hypothetical protein
MANDRKTGAGKLASGVLERLTPLDAGQIEETAEISTEIDAGKGRALRKGGRKLATSGHTIYLPDALFERILVQAHRKKRTISEYVTVILERQVPDYRTTRADSTETDAA